MTKRRMPVSEDRFKDAQDPALEIKESDEANLDIIEKRLLLTLDRASIHLAKAVSRGLPNEAELSAIIRYLKIVRDLKNDTIKDLDNLSDDELKKIIEKEQHEEASEADKNS